MLASRLFARLASRSQFTSHHATSSHTTTLRVSRLAIAGSRRVFASTPRHRKDDARIRTQQAELQAKQPAPENVKPELTEREKPAEPTQPNDPLLSEQTKTRKEQRTADWRIIKDMSHYIWPKDDFGTRFRVGLSVVLLVGAKVGSHLPPTVAHTLIDICRSSMFRFPSTSRPSWTV